MCRSIIDYSINGTVLIRKGYIICKSSYEVMTFFVNINKLFIILYTFNQSFLDSYITYVKIFLLLPRHDIVLNN